jgi:zinc and cadmium transporter
MQGGKDGVRVMTLATLGLWRAIGGVVAVMMVGALLPLWLPRRGWVLSYGLATAAGILLAAALLHLIPEAFAILGERVGMGVLAGFLFLYLFERFVTVHICETLNCHFHTVGLSALFGLSLHTLANGVAIGAGVSGGMGSVVFLAIAAHKLPEAFSLTAILLHERYPRKHIAWMNALFMSMIPLGALSVRGLAGALMSHGVIAWALAFSAGTFIHIAVSDLLPEVHERSAHRVAPAIAFLLGIGITMALGHLAH